MTSLPRCRLLTLLLVAGLSYTQSQTAPNIVLILADDAGWGDFQGHDEFMVTPNIFKLKDEGLFLDQSYSMPICLPARAALLTGRYPHTFGMQHNIGGSRGPKWLNETLTILPEEMRRLGYRTHMVGKWHLGHCHPGIRPMGRGFDTYYGFILGGHASYYTHETGDLIYDWWDGDTIDWSAQGKYQTELLTNRSVKIINEANISQPFFMYLSYGAPHSPIEVPQHYEDDYCSHVTNEERKTYCGMMAAMDEGVGKVVQALKDKGIYDNTVILFLSDNGGTGKYGSTNWPLRGSKFTPYEGGIRSYTVLKAPGLSATNITWSGLVHVIDWLPTLLTIAGGQRPSYAHGKNLWKRMKNNKASQRRTLLYVDDFYKFNCTAVRYKKWKLFGAVPGLDSSSRWKQGNGIDRYPPFQVENAQDITFPKEKYSTSEYLLYNLKADPYEITDLASNPAYAKRLEMMKKKLAKLLQLYPLQPLQTNIPLSENAVVNGTLTTCWCEPPTKPPCPVTN